MNQLRIIIYEDFSSSKKIYSIFNMSAQRDGTDRGLTARCISLLQEVKDLIEAHALENASQLAGNVRPSGDSGPSRSSSEATNQTNQQRLMSNFRSLFAPYSSSARASSSSRPPPAKKQRTFYKVKETCTHDFFCLAWFQLEMWRL